MPARGTGQFGRSMLAGVWGIIRTIMNTDFIQCDPAVMMGKPVIAGTRITIELILEKLAAGETIEQILEAHPRLTRESILAAHLNSSVKYLSSSRDK